MPQLSEVVHISKRRESRKARVVPYAEFEPLLSRLRQALETNQQEAMRYIGYGGGTMLSEWQRDGVPLIAVNAIRWALHDLKQPTDGPTPSAPRAFSADELGHLLNATLGNPVRDDVRAALVRKLAAELAR